MRITLRDYLSEKDPENIYLIVKDTGFFKEEEAVMAKELALSELSKPGEYLFFVAEYGDKSVGYACYGNIPCSLGGYELYWIAVIREFQHHGTGKILLAAVEKAVRELGGRKIFVGTSGTDKYTPTRAFYEKNAYMKCAVLEDYFDLGDDEVIYEKVLSVR
ncbi:MAG: GNAT family N-acetyltransferase [Deferribacteraceae bacterium]|jgi:GNAT superfamily N-acetyltransferase|nr:GNAT family N-acetyltransferase [Deferribacteraceae bacterium]